jgi:tRNA (mo5U34)-methyltransferase
VKGALPRRASLDREKIGNTGLTKPQLLKKIRSFKYWHYPFELPNGIVIKPTENSNATEKPHLRDFIWPEVLRLCGGSLKGLRVLDVGCNAGFWSLEAYRSGAAYVLGVDPRPMHIEQAQLVRDALGISPKQVEFRQMSVDNLSREELGRYDLVLLLRVLQHLRDPLGALERLRKVCRSYLVLELKIVLIDLPVLCLIPEDPRRPIVGIHEVALRPTQSALRLMLKASGFSDVKRVRWRKRGPGQPKYRLDKRALFTARVPGP